MILILLSALWLGILTSISPCPLATNIAAISYIGRHVNSPVRVCFAGLLYTFGRTLAYTAIAVIVVAGLLSIPSTANLLQKYINVALGPILIFVGILLLELVRVNIPNIGSSKLQNKAQEFGIWGAGLIGILFALSFCPVSAALFFGSLIPLSIQHKSMFLFPSIYGIGTALPVIVFAFVIALSIGSVGKLYNKITQFEFWTRHITGIIFILAGIYFSLIYIFKIQIINF